MLNLTKKEYIEVIGALILLVAYPTLVALLQMSPEDKRAVFMGIVTLAAFLYLPKYRQKLEIVNK